MSLGKIKKIDLRKAWQHEALDFTKWLAEEENLSLLSDELGIGIRLIQTEAEVGDFYVDILAEEEDTDKKIIIENQLENTDHEHLGKLITYASGYDAEIIIWVVREVKEEHKRAVDWLNEHTDEKLNFFLVKVELWQINESPYAPKFQVISNPNEWAKILKQSSGKNELTETKIMQLDFWNKFKEYAIENKTKLRLRKTYPQHWHSISFGSSDAHIALTVDTRANMLGCEIYIDNSKELYHSLFKNKTQIETELGIKLEWMELEGKKASRIKYSRKDSDLTDKNKWNDYFAWFKTNAENFQKVFGKYVKNLKD